MKYEIIKNLVVKLLGKGCSAKLVFTGICFWPGHMLVDSTTEKTAEWLMIRIPNLPRWKEAKFSTYAGDDIPGTHMMRVYVSKTAALETEDEGLYYLTLLFSYASIAHHHTFKNDLITIEIDNRSLKAIKWQNCLFNYRSGNIPVRIIGWKTYQDTPITGWQANRPAAQWEEENGQLCSESSRAQGRERYWGKRRASVEKGHIPTVEKSFKL